MRRTMALSFLVVCSILAVSSMAAAWEVSYECNATPEDPSLGAGVWSSLGTLNALNTTSVSDGILHVVDASESKTAWFYHGGSTPAGTPVTVEARLRIASSLRTVAWGGPACLSVQNAGAAMHLYMSTNSLSVNNVPSQTYTVDMTSFHAIRLALDAQNGYRLWLDGSELGSGTGAAMGGTLYSARFGATTANNNSDSYWDYVRYSKSYEPVPEPSSLLVLFGGLTGLAGRVLRERG